MKEMLSSAYDNLRSIDRQVSLIYNQIQLQSDLGRSNLRQGPMQEMLAKTISDLFFFKMQKSLGFTLNIKSSCNIFEPLYPLAIQQAGKSERAERDGRFSAHQPHCGRGDRL